MRRLAQAGLVAMTLWGVASPAAQAQEIRIVDWPAAETEPGVQLGWRMQLRLGNLIVPKNGVPNALRYGLAGGLWLRSLGPFDLALDATGLFGSSDKDGYSFAFGAAVEAQWRPPGVDLGIYLTTGTHFFVSRATEDREGLSWRAALGVRVLLNSGWFVGFEPLGIERLPDGPGPYTPLRSRWAWDITWVSVGYGR